MGVLASFLRIIWSGIDPGPNDSKAWYDRLIRVGGGLFIVGVILYLLLTSSRR
jgi:hypothetical protein